MNAIAQVWQRPCGALPLEEIRNNIRAAGLEAIERNGRYESLAARAR